MLSMSFYSKWVENVFVVFNSLSTLIIFMSSAIADNAEQ